MNVNVLIVTTDASYVSSQYDSWEIARAEVARKMSDPWYNSRMTMASPVFMRETSDSSSVLEQHTVGDIVRGLASAVTKLSLGAGHEELLSNACDQLSEAGYMYDEDFTALYAGAYVFTGIQLMGAKQSEAKQLLVSIFKGAGVVATEAR